MNPDRIHGDGGRGDPNDTGRPPIPFVPCLRHPGTQSTGTCPRCLREAAEAAAKGGAK